MIEAQTIDRKILKAPFESISEVALSLIDLAHHSTKPDSPLFALLEWYRFTYTENRAEYTHMTTFKLFEAINTENAEHIETLLTTIAKTTEKTLSLLNPKVAESYVSPINLKFKKKRCESIAKFISQDLNGMTPLRFLIQAIPKYSKNNSNTDRIVQLLIASNANVNEPGLLFDTFKKRNFKGANYLIAHKADVNLFSMHGLPPIISALTYLTNYSEKEKTSTLECLVKAGANPDTPLEDDDYTPLMACVHYPHKIRTFNFFLKVSDITLINKYNQTALITCIKYSALDKAKSFLKAAKLRRLLSVVNHQDNQGNTALHHTVLEYIRIRMILNDQIKNEYKPSKKSKLEKQLMNQTEEFKNLTILLISSNADRNLVNHNGKTPYQLALEQGLELVEFLTPNSETTPKRKKVEEENQSSARGKLPKLTHVSDKENESSNTTECKFTYSIKKVARGKITILKNRKK